ncbi:hypothetical protein RJ641_031152 [Dillenia turbinata]|uniref:Uncharacterized protein n=1 Tax=Dillenia turbinata TaxID=194707 RepID=A0AAN8VPJ2_9MAGN
MACGKRIISHPVTSPAATIPPAPTSYKQPSTSPSHMGNVLQEVDLFMNKARGGKMKEKPAICFPYGLAPPPALTQWTFHSSILGTLFCYLICRDGKSTHANASGWGL